MKRMKGTKSQETAAIENSAVTHPAKSGKKRKKALVIIAVVLVLLLIVRIAGCSLGGEEGAMVTTGHAVRGDLQESISTSGTVESEEVLAVFAPISGILDTVNVAAGDAVQAGDLLVSYDMARLESSMRQSELQYEKSNANYDGVMADNAQNQAKLNEANVNLDVLNQQIADTKAYLKDLENELSESQRHTSNALAEESMNLTNSLRARESELAALRAQLESLLTSSENAAGTDNASPTEGAVPENSEGSSDGSDLPENPVENEDPVSVLQTKIAEKEKEISDINEAITRNGYATTTAGNSDYIAELQQKIGDAQEQLESYETYKSEMQGQKSSTENAVLDSYDKTSYSADKEIAGLTYQETEEDYNLARDGIRARFTGIITECSAISGSGVSSGAQLMTLESSENVKVVFSASKYDIEKLEIGQKADVTISGHVYEGAVSKINRMAQTNASNTPMVGVEVHLTSPDDNIILGMDAKLTVYTRKAENTLMIPVEAVNADKDGDFLYVAEEGRVVRKPIVCGISTDTYTEVLEGITEEDEVILMSYTNLEEGMPVTVMPAQ